MIDFFRKIKIDAYLYVGNLIGNIISIFKRKKYGNINSFSTITFDIRARIGDGVVLKPVIILFSKYIKEILKLNIDIVVQVNEYNRFVFEDNNLGIYYKCEVFGIEPDKHLILKDYIKDLYKRFIKYKMYTRNKRKFKNEKKNLKKKLYISYNPNHIIEDNSDVRIGRNLWLDNYLLDYWFNETKYSILSHIDCISGYFRLSDFRTYIQEHIDYFYKDYNNGKKSGILIFVGNKKVRNLSVDVRHELIINIGKSIKSKVYIIDDNSNTIYHALVKYNDYTDNIIILKNSFTLTEFKQFSKNFQLLIGGDGGGFNYIRTCSNSITIYTLGNHNIWHIFTGNKKYTKTYLGNNWVQNDISINSKNFGYIYKKSLKLPSSDYSVGDSFFDDFPVYAFIKIIDKYL